MNSWQSLRTGSSNIKLKLTVMPESFKTRLTKLVENVMKLTRGLMVRKSLTVTIFSSKSTVTMMRRIDIAMSKSLQMIVTWHSLMNCNKILSRTKLDTWQSITTRN